MTSHRGSSRTLRCFISAAGAAITLALVFPSTALAAGTPTKVEQGWELLSQAVSNQVVSTTITLNRGSLGGTFTPSPTLIFEVAGKVTGGTNGSWSVALRNQSAQTIASVSFAHGSDSNFNLHTGSVSYSTGDEAASIALTSSGTNPGTLSINKAYIRFKQNGVVKGTDAHVSMTTAQTGITTSTYTTVFNPTVYKHVTGDYSPAPTVKLRVTGSAGPRTKLYVQLTTEAGTPVSNSEIIFSNTSATDPTPPASLETAALTLSNNTKYVVAARVLDVAASGNGPQGDGPSVSPTGDLLSADLELRQSTTDARGLEKSVSWNGSVSSATTVPPTGNLNFLFDAPVIQAPCSTPTWQTVVSGTSMAANMQDTSSANALTNATTYTGTGYSLQPVSASVPTEGHILDTNIATGGAGTITWSALRYALCLWDAVNPTITNFRVSQTPFNPYAGSTSFLATLADDFALDTWTIAISRHSDGLNVRNLTGTAANLSTPWDGKNDSGAYVAGGLYDATLTALDTTGNSATSVIGVTVAFPPVISNYLASDLYFSPGVSPGVRDDTTFSAALSGDAPPFSWTLTIKNAGGQTKKTYTGNGTPVSQTWNGQDSAGAYVADGMYTATLSVTDAIGSVTTTTLSTNVTVDRSAPVIYSFPTMYLSGSGNGNHSTSISPSLSDSSWPLTYNATIRDSGNNVVRTLSGTSISWDGKNGSGVLQPDGSYTVALSVTDAQNLTANANSSVVIDSVSPAITNPAVSEPYFSPNGDGVKDTTTITATISDSNLSHWLVKPRVTCPNGCSSSSGSSSNLSFVWNGRVGMWNGSTYVPTLQPDGSYIITSSVYDLAGNSTAQDLVTTTIDTVLPSVTVPPVASNPAFSPNADSVKDATVLSETTSDAHPGTWSVQLKDSSSQVRRVFAGAGSSISATWDGQDGSALLVADGNYRADVTSTDAAGNSVLRTIDTVVDTVAPVIKDLQPQDHGNTIFVSQPLSARILDANPGSASEITFTLTDETNPAAIVTTTPATSTFTATRAKTAAVALTLGHTYRLQVQSVDAAGNLANLAQDAASDGGGFLVTSFQAWPSSTQMPPVRCNIVGAADLLNNTVSCPDISLHLDSAPVILGSGGYSSRHAGAGYVEQLVSLQSAQLYTKVNGNALPGVSPAHTAGNWGDVSVSTQFVVLERAGAQTRRTIGADVGLGALTTVAPKGWSEVWLRMDAVNATLDNSFNTIAAGSAACVDPSVSTTGCTSDPIRFFIHDSVADRKLVHMVDGDETVGAPEEVPSYTAEQFFLMYRDEIYHWEKATTQSVCAYTAGTCFGRGFVPTYGSYPGIVPSSYRSVCARGIAACKYDAVPTADTPDETDVYAKQALLLSTSWSHDTSHTSDSRDPDHNASNNDWWTFNSDAYIEQYHAYNKTGIGKAPTYCDSSDYCWGLHDDELYDGAWVSWPGNSWIMPASFSGRPGYENTPWLPYFTKQEQFGQGSTCFHGYSKKVPNSGEARNQVYWDQTNTVVAGTVPSNGKYAQAGITTVGTSGNLSMATKGPQSGQFAGPGFLNACPWTTYDYYMYANIYQNGGSTVTGQQQAEFLHAWNETTWSWSWGLGGFTANASSATDYWQVRHFGSGYIS